MKPSGLLGRGIYASAIRAILEKQSIGALINGYEEQRALANAMLKIIKDDAPREMAMTDPHQYVRLRSAITHYHLNGVGVKYNA